MLRLRLNAAAAKVTSEAPCGKGHAFHTVMSNTVLEHLDLDVLSFEPLECHLLEEDLSAVRRENELQQDSKILISEVC